MTVGVSGPYLARTLGGWRAAGPAYLALARALRLLILDGRLPLRTRLPGERELADALGVKQHIATALRHPTVVRRQAAAMDAAVLVGQAVASS